MTQAEQTPEADDMIPEYFFCLMTIKEISGKKIECNTIPQWLNAQVIRPAL
jgi:hypothetical protein